MILLILVKLKYKLQFDHKIKINVDIKFGSHILPLGRKKMYFNYGQLLILVIAPAKTGKDNKSYKALIPTDQTNNGIWSNDRLLIRMLIIVVIK